MAVQMNHLARFGYGRQAAPVELARANCGSMPSIAA
jgi:hypothetical protein